MNWMLTHSAIAFNLGRPTPAMVCVEDIAHHLALTNRFCGATTRALSVAEHSLFVAEILQRNGGVQDPMCLRAALLHDAHEAYVGDISTPVKTFLGPHWARLEDGVMDAVQQHFGIAQAARAHQIVIKHADLMALATERRDLMPMHAAEWPVLRGVQPVDWIDLNDREGMDWTDWRLAFLCRHAELAAQIEQDEQAKRHQRAGGRASTAP